MHLLIIEYSFTLTEYDENLLIIAWAVSTVIGLAQIISSAETHSIKLKISLCSVVLDLKRGNQKLITRRLFAYVI